MKNLDGIKLMMNKNLFESVKESFEEVVSMFLMEQVNLITQMDGMKTPIKGERVTIGISLTEDLNGSIFLTMNLDTAKKIVSLMTMEGCVDELNEFHESALREMLNMIAGTFVSKSSSLINPYSNEFYSIDISSPISIVSDSGILIWVDKISEIREFLFEVEDIGEIIMYLGIKAI